MSATGDRAAGKGKELVGKVTGDRDLEGEGKGQHLAGKAEEKVIDVKKKAGAAVEKVTGRS